MSRETLVGRTVAGYTLRSLVGEGGTSAVYKADHPQHGVVALKVLREKLRNDQTAVARFVREARYGTRVEHPNVVHTIEIGDDGGLHYLAIEWSDGEILDRYARKRGPLPPAEVATIILQIADAVHAAHLAGIVHRDLKPENVMYDPVKNQVKLLDFGIAMDTQPGADERLTRAGFFVGTLMYVAPEALTGEVVGPAADQYSLATIAYFLLTSCLPYTAKTPREMFTQLLKENPTPLNRAREGLHFGSAVEGVIMRGLSKQPAHRYPDVMALAEALAVALRDQTPADEEGVFSKMKGLFRKK